MIETERLHLRRMVPEDIEDLLGVFGDPKVMESFREPPFSRDQMKSWIDRNLAHQDEHGYGLYSVLLKAERRVIGDCGLEHMTLDGKSVVELGYDLGSRYWGQGLATEAARAVRDFAFSVLGMGRVVSMIRPHNAPSQRVSEKIGMRKTRELRQHGRDYLLYSITRVDWQEQTARESAEGETR